MTVSMNLAIRQHAIMLKLSIKTIRRYIMHKINTDKYRVKPATKGEQNRRVKALREEYAKKTVKSLIEYRAKLDALQALDRR